MSETFSCWTCPQKHQACIEQTYRKDNWPTCQAASKGLGFPIFATEGDCEKYCDPGGKKPLPVSPVCWYCGGPESNFECKHFLGSPETGCPMSPGVYKTKEECQKTCTPFKPLKPPPLQPLTPPLEPVVPVRDLRYLWYILIVVGVLLFLGLIVGALILLR